MQCKFESGFFVACRGAGGFLLGWVFLHFKVVSSVPISRYPGVASYPEYFGVGVPIYPFPVQQRYIPRMDFRSTCNKVVDIVWNRERTLC